MANNNEPNHDDIIVFPNTSMRMVFVDIEASHNGSGIVELILHAASGEVYRTKASVHYVMGTRRGDANIYVQNNSCSILVKPGDFVTGNLTRRGTVTWKGVVITMSGDFEANSLDGQLKIIDLGPAD